MVCTVLDEGPGLPPRLHRASVGARRRDPLGRAYNRATHLPARRKMMRAWADYLDALREGKGDKVFRGRTVAGTYGHRPLGSAWQAIGKSERHNGEWYGCFFASRTPDRRLQSFCPFIHDNPGRRSTAWNPLRGHYGYGSGKPMCLDPQALCFILLACVTGKCHRARITEKLDQLLALAIG